MNVTISSCIIKKITKNSPTNRKTGWYAEVKTSTGTEYIIERDTKKELTERIQKRSYK